MQAGAASDELEQMPCQAWMTFRVQCFDLRSEVLMQDSEHQQTNELPMEERQNQAEMAEELLINKTTPNNGQEPLMDETQNEAEKNEQQFMDETQNEDEKLPLTMDETQNQAEQLHINETPTRSGACHG